jgi:hypothetical protein
MVINLKKRKIRLSKGLNSLQLVKEALFDMVTFEPRPESLKDTTCTIPVTSREGEQSKRQL